MIFESSNSGDLSEVLLFFLLNNALTNILFNGNINSLIDLEMWHVGFCCS